MPKASKTMTATKARLKSIKKKARIDPSSTLKGSKISKRVDGVQPISIQKGKNKAVQKPMSTLTDDSPLLPSTFIVVAGSYEKLLYGLQGTVSLTDSPSSSSSPFTFNLKPIFIFPAHVSCIKAVTASPAGGKWLATGSADEIIKVWDLRRRKEIGGLMHHEGPVHMRSLLLRYFHPLLWNCRLDHTFKFSFPFPSPLRVRRWLTLPLPHTRLDCPSKSERPQRTCELCCCPSFL
jgi:WD40 repeat protein